MGLLMGLTYGRFFFFLSLFFAQRRDNQSIINCDEIRINLNLQPILPEVGNQFPLITTCVRAVRGDRALVKVLS